MREKTKPEPPTVTHHRMLIYERGRRNFRLGKPCLERPLDDEFTNGTCTDEGVEWLGWMTERGMMLMKQWKVRDYILGDGDLDD